MPIENTNFEGWPSGDYTMVLAINRHPEAITHRYELSSLEYGVDELDDFVATHCSMTGIGPVVFQHYLHDPHQQTLVLIDSDECPDDAIQAVVETFELKPKEITWRLDICAASADA